jgi:hypothetical protein
MIAHVAMLGCSAWSTRNDMMVHMQRVHATCAGAAKHVRTDSRVNAESQKGKPLTTRPGAKQTNVPYIDAYETKRYDQHMRRHTLIEHPVFILLLQILFFLPCFLNKAADF